MSFVFASPRAVPIVVAAAGVLLTLPHAQAQWWKRAPVDFEECADAAEQSSTKAEKTAALADCNAKFAGRRKPGGGYTYYDFLQDRSFDIAGPNPTPQEQKRIDESYTAYLAEQRRNNAAAEAALREQREQQERQLQRIALHSDVEHVPVPAARPKVSQPVSHEARGRAKAATCTRDSFSCEWPRLSEGLNELKKLFSPAPDKPPKKG